MSQAIEASKTERRALAEFVRAYVDVLAGLLGVGSVLVAITVLTSWPWALLAAGVVLIALSLVVPQWD